MLEYFMVREFLMIDFKFAGANNAFKKNMSFSGSISSLNSFGSQLLNDPDIWPSVEDDPDIWPSPVPAGHKFVSVDFVC